MNFHYIYNIYNKVCSRYNKVCSRATLAVLLASLLVAVGTEMQARTKLSDRQVQVLKKKGLLRSEPTKGTLPLKQINPNKTQMTTSTVELNSVINAQASQEAEVDNVQLPAVGTHNVNSEEINKRKDDLNIQLGGVNNELANKTNQLNGLKRGERQPLSEYLTKKREIENEIASINLKRTQIQLQLEELRH